MTTTDPLRVPVDAVLWLEAAHELAGEEQAGVAGQGGSSSPILTRVLALRRG